jgi:DNA-binding NarL/FixJ family response regulator
VRLADMLAHYAQGQAIAPIQLLAVARRIGLGPQDLREVLFELPGPPPDRRRSVTPCPLSTRELEVLKRLAEGKVYKQIALELGLSTSTVRTHLHNVYGKLGAVDAAGGVDRLGAGLAVASSAATPWASSASTRSNSSSCSRS